MSTSPLSPEDSAEIAVSFLPEADPFTVPTFDDDLDEANDQHHYEVEVQSLLDDTSLAVKAGREKLKAALKNARKAEEQLAETLTAQGYDSPESLVAGMREALTGQVNAQSRERS